MRKALRRVPTPAMIIAVIALVAALGGTAIAGGSFLPKRKFSNFKQNVAVRGPITYVNQTQNVNNNGTANTPGQNITATCPSGFFPVGGGAKTSESSASSGFFVLNSYPSASGWTALVFAGTTTGPTPSPESITVTAICEKGKTSGTPPTITP